MGRLFVRTASAGTGIDVEILDLGVNIVSGVDWTEMSSMMEGVPLEASGQFTATEIRDSRDLYDGITSSGLEWSGDSLIIEAPADYSANYLFIEEIYEDFQRADDVATKLDLLLDEDGDYTYIGEAAPGSSSSSAVWRVFRLDESESGDEELLKKYANGDAAFVHIWNNRGSFSY